MKKNCGTCRCSVDKIINCLCLKKLHIFCHLKLEIALEIPALKWMKNGRKQFILIVITSMVQRLSISLSSKSAILNFIKLNFFREYSSCTFTVFTAWIYCTIIVFTELGLDICWTSLVSTIPVHNGSSALSVHMSSVCVGAVIYVIHWPSIVWICMWI